MKPSRVTHILRSAGLVDFSMVRKKIMKDAQNFETLWATFTDTVPETLTESSVVVDAIEIEIAGVGGAPSSSPHPVMSTDAEARIARHREHACRFIVSKDQPFFPKRMPFAILTQGSPP